MSPEPPPTAPDPEAIARSIRQTYPDTDVVTMNGAAFSSLDREKHWPNFATVVWTDDFDHDLSRPGVFRLNVGVGRETFNRLVGSMAEPDYAALDRLFPPYRIRAAALDLDPQTKRRVRKTLGAMTSVSRSRPAQRPVPR